jgi:hypothetical protein
MTITMLRTSMLLILGLAVALPLRGDEQAASEEKKPHPVVLGEGAIQLTAPAAWQSKQPATRIVDFEFAIPASAEDEADGRLTIMGAGGSVEQNIERWNGQFARQTKSSAKQVKVAGVDVHLVDISGVYKDSKGPFAPVELREDYRMLGAIIATEKLGKYFLKLYGPAKTIADNEQAFLAMVESLTIKQP